MSQCNGDLVEVFKKKIVMYDFKVNILNWIKIWRRQKLYLEIYKYIQEFLQESQKHFESLFENNIVSPHGFSLSATMMCAIYLWAGQYDEGSLTSCNQYIRDGQHYDYHKRILENQYVQRYIANAKIGD